LQIGKDTDTSTGLLAEFPNRIGAIDVILCRAVRKIQAYHVNTSVKQRFKHTGFIGGRAQSGYNFGSS
jgi:hypothetical protein